MPSSNYIYRILYNSAAHDTQPDKTICIDIHDMESADTLTTELTGIAFRETVENLGEERYGLKGRRVTIQFLSTDTIGATTFCRDSDGRFFVDAYAVDTGERIFQGFLVQDDISEALLDPPNVVTLTAGDQLGLLKDEPLVTADGINPRGHYTVIDYVAWALRPTNLDLPIYWVDNVKEEHDTTKPWYRSCFMEARTWEQDINTSENCYEVLSKVLGEWSFLCQYNGAWYLIRVDEYDQPTATAHQFDSAGGYVTSTTIDLNLVIGAGEKMYLSEGGARVTPKRAWKHVKETYPFELPKELINNINFERGELISTTPITGQPTYDEERRYAITDWMSWRRYSTKLDELVSQIDYYIVRRFKEGYEVERFIELTSPPSIASPWHHIETLDGTPMMAGDKFTFSVDFRFEADITGSGSITHDVGHCRLEGNDGSIWTMDQNGYWFLSPQHREMGHAFYREDEKENEWISYSVTSKALPVSGKVYFALYWASDPTANILSTNLYYANLRMEYTPIINGNYGKYSGQYHKVSQTLQSKAVREKTVNVSDSPKPLFKGALMYYTGTAYTLAGDFYNGAVVTGTPTASDLHPYGHLQAFDVWNQGNRVMRTIDVIVKGIRVDGTLPGLIHRYRLSDTSQHTDNKYFQLISGTFDWVESRWEGLVVEVYDEQLGKTYSDTHEFKYQEGR